MVKNVDLKTALSPHQGHEQADRTGTGDEQRLRMPRSRALADMPGVIPRLGDNAGGFQQDTETSQDWIDLDDEFGLHAETFRAIAMALLDTALRVAAVATHVPLARRAGDTGDRIRTPPHRNDEVARQQAAALGRILDHPQRLMTEK